MKLYLDESVSVVLAAVLSQHGLDCQTARDARQLGAADDVQLSYAAAAGRVLFTHDTRDFLRLAATWERAGRPHAGILLAHQASLGELIRRFRTFLVRDKDSDLANLVMWLPSPLDSPLSAEKEGR